MRRQSGKTGGSRLEASDILDNDTPNTKFQKRFLVETCNPDTRTKNLLFGENGILIPPRNGDALAEAIRFFIEHPEQIAIMGQASRQYAEDRYDVRKVNAVMLREMGLVE